MKIQSGTGKNLEAEVNEEHRLMASSVTSTESEHNCDKGNKFVINTGDITLTNATKTTLLYVKNLSSDPMFIFREEYSLGASTGGSGDVLLEVVKEPLSGDIITNANDVAIAVNQNFGSTKPFDANAYKGASGETLVSEGFVARSSRVPDSSSMVCPNLGIFIIPKGSSFAINYTPPVGNTSQTVQIACSVFFQDIVV